MTRKLWLTAVSLLLLAVSTRTIQAQSPCAHVDFRLDTTLPLDQAAVCAAAQPWADQDLRVFVYLTDVNPTGEDAWYDLLDQVEAAAGLRDLSQADGFNRSTIAFEASATSNAAWAHTVTIGKALFETPLETDDGLAQASARLRAGLQQGDATSAFTNAITTAHAIAYPPPPPPPYGLLAAGAVVAVGLGGLALYRPLLRPAVDRRRRRRALQAQLDRLRQNVANLLLACERLLAGDGPRATALYQLFEAYGGTKYAERETAVRQWIAVSQTALREAFDLRRELLREEAQAARSLEQQVHDWEMIYLTLVGSSPQVLNLTEAELRDLLDPLLILEREAEQAPLAAQLRDISRQLAGMPLKVELMEVKAEEANKAGILGYVDQVETQLAELMAAQRDAPPALEQAQRDRLAAEEEADAARPFGLTGSQIVAGIDAQLTTAREALAQQRYLDALTAVQTVQRDLEIIADVVQAAADHAQRAAAIAAITAEGYRPESLPALRAEIEEDVAQISACLRAGDYLAADDWIDELDADSRRALEDAEAWRERQRFNAESLRLMETRLVEATAYLETEAASAWQALQAYPAPNWRDITPDLAEQRAALEALRTQRLPHLAELNSLTVQQIPAAESQLAEAGADLVQLERRLQALVSRLAEVRAAEANLPSGLALAQTALAQAVALRDAEDPKIGPEVDAQLAEAARRLEAAQAGAQARHFVAAMEALLAARQLAGAAYVSAEEQVARINALQAELEQVSTTAVQQARRTTAKAERLTPQAQTAATQALLQDVNASYSQARQAQAESLSLEDAALAAALATAVAAFTRAAQLGAQAETRIDADREAYERLRRDAETAVQRAESAIHQAHLAVHQADAGGAGRQALDRARRELAAAGAPAGAGGEALQQIRQAAERACAAAEEARRKADAAVAFRRAAHAAAWMIAMSGRPRPPGSGGWSAPAGGGVRPRASNRASTSGGSIRSSSGGAARRSSALGGSQRSASGGSRRSGSSGGSRRG
jgi:hypothetical protein